MILKVRIYMTTNVGIYMTTNVGIYMTTNVAVYNATNVAGDDECAAETVTCPVFSEFPKCPENPELLLAKNFTSSSKNPDLAVFRDALEFIPFFQKI